MDIEKHAIILEVIEQLANHGSWTGKTHVIKTLYLLKSTGKIEVPLEFLLYKHGPYSFEVESEIEEMLSYSAINYSNRMQGYGRSFNAGENTEFVKKNGQLKAEVKDIIEKVCKFVNNRDVRELEELATVAWIQKEEKANTY